MEVCSSVSLHWDTHWGPPCTAVYRVVHCTTLKGYISIDDGMHGSAWSCVGKSPDIHLCFSAPVLTECLGFQTCATPLSQVWVLLRSPTLIPVASSSLLLTPEFLDPCGRRNWVLSASWNCFWYMRQLKEFRNPPSFLSIVSHRKWTLQPEGTGECLCSG